MLSGIYLYSDNVDNVNEVEFSNMVLRHCPQLASFGFDRYTHSILGFPMLAKRITSRDTCIIARTKHVNGFLPILQHLRDNLANTKRVGRFRTIKTLALDRKLQINDISNIANKTALSVLQMSPNIETLELDMIDLTDDAMLDTLASMKHLTYLGAMILPQNQYSRLTTICIDDYQLTISSLHTTLHNLPL